MKDCFRIALYAFFIVLGLAAGYSLGRRSADAGGGLSGGDWRVDVRPMKADTVYQPQPRETVRVAVPATVDTGRIIADYYQEKRYCDTVRLAVSGGSVRDSAVAVIRDTVWQNGIAGRGVSFAFYPRRLAREHSVGLLSTFGYGSLTVMAEYRYRRLKMYAGYDVREHAPVAGVGYELLSW